MKKMLAAVAAGVAVALMAACNDGNEAPQESPGESVELGVPCYTKDGKFVKWDDDCHDDGLVVGPPKPVKTSDGLRTSGPVKPTVRKTRR